MTCRSCSTRSPMWAALLFASVHLVAPSAHGQNPRLQELDLEPSLHSAALVIAVRVEAISPMRVVYGGKGAQTIHQFTFAPIRVLKGVFSRPDLVLTSVDLQAYSHGFDPQDIEVGQQRLLILGRSNVGYYGIHQGSSAASSYPELSGRADPILGASESLLSQQQLSDRLDIVDRLSRDLAGAEGPGVDGPGAVVLLAALDRRSDVAAHHLTAFQATADTLTSEDPLVREVAAQVLGDLLEADYLMNEQARAAAVAALVESLQDPTAQLAPRVAALQALAVAPDALLGNPDAARLVAFDRPYDTLAELAARLEVLGRLHADRGGDAAERISALVAGLPFDAPDQLQRSATLALARIVPANAANQLLERLRSKKALGLEGIPEIEAFRLILPKIGNAWALQRALLEIDLVPSEQLAFVHASEDSPSPELVPALTEMLDPRQPNLRRAAAELLTKVDTRTAAEAIRPHLAEETSLDYKLLLAGFLGRHGFDDGYPYALEHMSEPRYLEAAVTAIAAIRKPGSSDSLIDIYRNSNDLDWQRAAVRALGLLGHDAFRDELIALTAEFAHPLAPAALLARADLGDADVIGLLPAALSSRNEPLVIAAARASHALSVEGHDLGHQATEIHSLLARLARDPGSMLAIRHSALEALLAAGDAQLDTVLVAMFRDRRLEDTGLMNRVRELMRERMVRI